MPISRRKKSDLPPPLKSEAEIKAENKYIKRRRPIVEEGFKQDKYVGRRYDIAPENISRRKQDCRELIFENYYDKIYRDKETKKAQKALELEMQMQLTQQQLFQAILN